MLRTAPPKLAQIQAPDRASAWTASSTSSAGSSSPTSRASPRSTTTSSRSAASSSAPACSCSAARWAARPTPEAETLAAVVELIHLATLVHDDAVDHSVLRRGMPTVNAMWSHQVAIIMGDYLYSRSVAELARLGDIEPVRVLAAASNAMSVGEMRQLASCDALAFGEARLLPAHRVQDRLAHLRRLRARRPHRRARAPRAACAASAASSAWPSRSSTTSSTTPPTRRSTGKPAGPRPARAQGHPAAHRASSPPLRRRDARGRRRSSPTPSPATRRSPRVVSLVREHGGLDYAKGEGARVRPERRRRPWRVCRTGPRCGALRDSIAYAVERRR